MIEDQEVTYAKKDNRIMTDNMDHTPSDLAVSRSNVNTNFKEFKESCTESDPLKGIRILYHRLKKLMLSTQHYDQIIKAYYSSTWTDVFLSTLLFQTVRHETTLNESIKFIERTKTAIYEVLHQRLNEQVNAVKASVEALLEVELFFSQSMRFNRDLPRDSISLFTIKKIATQSRWVESFLELEKDIQPMREKTAVEIQAEVTRAHKFSQTKILFHAIYTQSIKNLMMAVVDKLKSSDNAHKARYFTPIVNPRYMHMISHVNYIQSYGEYCIMPDADLHAEIVLFNDYVLSYFDQDYPNLKIVLRAQQSMTDTGARTSLLACYKS